MTRSPRTAVLLACLALVLQPSFPSRALGAPPKHPFQGIAGQGMSSSAVPEGETVAMTAPSIVTWEMPDTNSATGQVSIVQLGRSGSSTGIEIMVDRTKLTAQAAVVWISKTPDSVVDAQSVRIALLGDARVERDGVVRTGPNLYVTAAIRGDIRMSTAARIARDASSEGTYKVAVNLREVAEVPTERLGPAVFARPAGEPKPGRELQAEELRKLPVHVYADLMLSQEGPEGYAAVVCTGHFLLYGRDRKGDFLEIRADRAVMLTRLTKLLDADAFREGGGDMDSLDGIYLEGDVRISNVPGKLTTLGEQRLEANRAYYEVATDRAVLTDAVIHTLEPSKALPLVLRAKTIQQLSSGEYKAQHAEMSTSSFGVPTYSLRSTEMYVQHEENVDGNGGGRTTFEGDNVTLNALHLPFFYLPYAGGQVENFPLRSLAFESDDRFGQGFRTDWGLYEAMGMSPPKGLDASFRADYLSDRGPATGLDLNYHGGLVTETTAEPWNFEGRVKSYIINDHGYDSFNGARSDVHFENDARGQVLLEHQHFLPDDWQVQIRAGYSSDPTFLEQYFDQDFYTQLPYELAFYAKRQHDSEQLSFLTTISPNDFPTSADQVQEQVAVERYPEIGYRRIGESVLDDHFTFTSDNLASLLSFRNSGAFAHGGTNIPSQGYGLNLSPGIRDFDQTGVDADGDSRENTVGRADLRQELDYPLQAGQFKVVPYVVARYTGYSDSPDEYSVLAVPAVAQVDNSHGQVIVKPRPAIFKKYGTDGGDVNRIYAATGARLTTAFWRVDDTVDSELFDIHRVRHVVEPVANFYASGSTVDATNLYVYDAPIDEANDVQAAQFRLEQRWQTQRGGPGRWRSVDFFTLNVEYNGFSNKPDPYVFLNPKGFRGLYFDSLPEASVARDSVNSDATWRVSDTMIVLADEEYNVDAARLATAAAGFSVQRDLRLSYFLEQRYIDLLNSNITSVGITYEISPKYAVQLMQSYDFSQQNNVSSSVSVIRKFDRLIGILTAYQDSINDETGFRFALLPEGLNSGASNKFFNALNPQNTQKNK